MADKNVRDFFNSLPVKDFPASEDVALLLDSEHSSGGFPLLRRVPFNNILSLEKTNTIIVNENAIRNIGGKLYSNLSAAITWINSITPAPSVTNTWNIVVEGDYNPDTEESSSRGYYIRNWWKYYWSKCNRRFTSTKCYEFFDG